MPEMSTSEKENDFNLPSEIIEAATKWEVQVFNGAWDEEGVYFYQVSLFKSVIRLQVFNSAWDVYVNFIFGIFLTLCAIK